MNRTRKRGSCDALQLEAAAPVLMPFNYDARAKFLIAEPVCCCPIALPAVAVVKLWTRFEHRRAIHGAVIAISVYELMTLNFCHILRFVLG